MSNDPNEYRRARSSPGSDSYVFDSAQLDCWLEDGTRPFLDILATLDDVIKCVRVRREEEAITERLRWMWIEQGSRA